jgi:hypothetical protein
LYDETGALFVVVMFSKNICIIVTLHWQSGGHKKSGDK